MTTDAVDCVKAIKISQHFHEKTRCVCETRMPRNGHFLRNVTFIFDLDLCR